MAILDQGKFPLREPMAQELLRTMAAFYPSERTALRFVARFGIGAADIRPNLSAIERWYDLLNMLAKRGKLRAAVEAARDEFSENPSALFLDALLADKSAPVSAEPLGKGDDPGDAAGPTAIVKGVGVYLPLAALANIGGWAIRGVDVAARAFGQWRRCRKAEDRRVDLALLKMDEKATAVTDDEALLPLARYRVRVHIGERSPESLLPAPPPPILPLLPQSESGHDLEVTIFGKDFAIYGTTTRPLFLPADGASEAVYFEITDPQQPGPARFESPSTIKSSGSVVRFQRRGRLDRASGSRESSLPARIQPNRKLQEFVGAGPARPLDRSQR